jgi:hypothetical protein
MDRTREKSKRQTIRTVCLVSRACCRSLDGIWVSILDNG